MARQPIGEGGAQPGRGVAPGRFPAADPQLLWGDQSVAGARRSNHARFPFSAAVLSFDFGDAAVAIAVRAVILLKARAGRIEVVPFQIELCAFFLREPGVDIDDAVLAADIVEELGRGLADEVLEIP